MTEERTGKGQPMTDDTWRRDRDDEEDEPLFDEHEPTRDHEAVDDGLTFGASDTGSLPHWTEPPTGEVPRLDREADVVAADAVGDDDELDVWSSFTSESPVWKDDSPTEPGPDAVPGGRRTGQHDVVAQRSRQRGRPRAVADHDRYRSVGHAAPAAGADRPATRRPAGGSSGEQPALGVRNRRVATCRWRRPSAC